LDTYVEETIAYFEVEILMGGYYDQIAIGITNNKNFNVSEFAGYSLESVGYHGDDGKCFVHGSPYTYGTKFGSKDVIGCGVTKSGNVYFVHNSCILPLLDVRIKGNIYVLISLRGKYSSVKVNHNPELVRFKHKKISTYKNPTAHLSYSHGISKIITANEQLLKSIQILARRAKQSLPSRNSSNHRVDSNGGNDIVISSDSSALNSEIIRKFKKYALIMHKICKHYKKNLLKYLLLGEETSNQINISSVKFSPYSSNYYMNEKNFSKNQNMIEKVLMRPIFDSGPSNDQVQKRDIIPENDILHQIPQEIKKEESKLQISSVQKSQTSFNKKNNTSRCNNTCSGRKCNIF
jgi:hypothetical protein